MIIISAMTKAKALLILSHQGNYTANEVTAAQNVSAYPLNGESDANITNDVNTVNNASGLGGGAGGGGGVNQPGDVNLKGTVGVNLQGGFALAIDGGTPLSLDVNNVPEIKVGGGTKPLDAKVSSLPEIILGGGTKPIDAKLSSLPEIKLGGGTSAISANIGGDSKNPIQLDPITLKIGKTQVSQHNRFTFWLFGCIPLFSLRTHGTIDIDPE